MTINGHLSLIVLTNHRACLDAKEYWVLRYGAEQEVSVAEAVDNLVDTIKRTEGEDWGVPTEEMGDWLIWLAMKQGALGRVFGATKEDIDRVTFPMDHVRWALGMQDTMCPLDHTHLTRAANLCKAMASEEGLSDAQRRTLVDRYLYFLPEGETYIVPLGRLREVTLG